MEGDVPFEGVAWGYPSQRKQPQAAARRHTQDGTNSKRVPCGSVSTHILVDDIPRLPPVHPPPRDDGPPPNPGGGGLSPNDGSPHPWGGGADTTQQFT